jgi:two-component system, NtrC family, sensor histidine kinase HydH
MDTQTFNITSSRTRLYLWIVIAVVIILITVLHFLTPTDQIVWHEIYQRIYYVPIISAALIFGLKGGLAASLFTTIIYSPHIYLHWQHGHFDYSINQYAEVVIFNLVGGTMGTLGDRLRRSRERAERNAEEKRKAYDELQTTFQQLLQAEKLASLGELSAGIVHEVRNPLASIKGAIEILGDELTVDSPRREFVGLAKGEIDRLDRLVGEFLQFARPTEPSKTPTDINEIVDAIAGLVENQAASQSVAIVKDLQRDLPLILVDAEQIKQVVLNLAINALQAVSQSNGADQTIKFRTFQQDNHLVVEVTDSGTGIAPANLSKIFDPFYTTKDKGVGLGLSIAHKIATQHKGHLTAKCTDHQTAFTLTLPLDLATRPGAENPTGT